MSVSLTFLGSGDAFGSDGRLQTCLALRGGDTVLLVDCGTTSLVAMKRAGLDPNEVGGVALTHLHGDHFGGLPFMILDAQFTRRTAPLVVAGPPGVQHRVQQAMEVLFPGSTAVQRRFAVEFVEWRERTPVSVPGAQVTAFPVVHASGAPPYALRIDYAGRSVAYSGDTEWTDSLVEAADGADCFVCEALTFDQPRKYHLDHATVSSHASRLRCRRVILTHMGPSMLARQADAGFECARDGLVVPLD